MYLITVWVLKIRNRLLKKGAKEQTGNGDVRLRETNKQMPLIA
jgi:hypothetical protein